jgi:hypothetical protein
MKCYENKFIINIGANVLSKLCTGGGCGPGFVPAFWIPILGFWFHGGD